jgi:hypothetical protein
MEVLKIIHTKLNIKAMTINAHSPADITSNLLTSIYDNSNSSHVWRHWFFHTLLTLGRRAWRGLSDFHHCENVREITEPAEM